ncbi:MULTISPECIES: ankyrin repeat domain-containing protein [unclassified Candidatus Cardinium]|uniref:ankyrin repeat domain-containing protein n=1 Tax=unclassified Candidatus Cardinium TaxID=2641185 RepID=UPI001FB2D5B9|nr:MULTISPECIES: ankyrin repeat domain-containing protein [unclassified Candidatus Cardinium]
MEQLNWKSYGFRSMVIFFLLLFLQIGCLKHSNNAFGIRERLIDENVNAKENTLYKPVRKFHQAVSAGDLIQVQSWLIYSNSFSHEEKKMFLNSLLDGKTALCKAIEQADEAMLRGLVKQSAIDINKTGQGFTSLVQALAYSDSKKAKAMALILLNSPTSKGLDVNTSDPHTGNTPLHIAACKGYTDIIDLLVEKSNTILNAQNNSGDTPLHLAVIRGDKDIVASLVEKPNIDVNAQNRSGNTPLHLAVFRGNEGIVSLLVEKPNIDVNAQNRSGNTPLHSAIVHDHKHLVALFVKHPKIALDKKNNHGYTPFHLARCRGDKHLVPLLDQTPYH